MKTLFSAAARCLSKPRLPSRCSHHKMLSALASSQRSRSSLDVQLEKFYTQSLEADDFFDVKKIVSMEECFDARMHLGHKRDCWHDGFQEYLYGNRLDVDIIDLEKTVERLKVALNAVAHVAFRNGIFLFTLRSGHRECHFVDQLAVQVGEYSNTRRWSETFLSARAARNKDIVRMPDMVILFSCHDSIFAPHPSIKEANNLAIPIVGLVDSNCDPRLISYPVPGNDDSPSSVRHFGSLVGKALMAGKEKRAQILNQIGVPTKLEDLFAYNIAAFKKSDSNPENISNINVGAS